MCWPLSWCSLPAPVLHPRRQALHSTSSARHNFLLLPHVLVLDVSLPCNAWLRPHGSCFTNAHRRLRCKKIMCTSVVIDCNPLHYYYCLRARLGAPRSAQWLCPMVWCMGHVGCGRCGLAQHVSCSQLRVEQCTCFVLLCPN